MCGFGPPSAVEVITLRTNAIDHLVAQLDRAYDRKSWHGTNLRGSLRNITLDQAAWRPGRGRHNIWELVVHSAYWKYAVWRRLSGGAARGSFPLEGSNFFARPETLSDSAWRADLGLLKEMHTRLRATVAAMGPADLHRVVQNGTVTAFELVAGIIAHDLYHAGQIQLIKQLYKGGRT